MANSIVWAEPAVQFETISLPFTCISQNVGISLLLVLPVGNVLAMLYIGVV
jgi:hypothetical protein